MSVLEMFSKCSTINFRELVEELEEIKNNINIPYYIIKNGVKVEIGSTSNILGVSKLQDYTRYNHGRNIVMENVKVHDAILDKNKVYTYTFDIPVSSNNIDTKIYNHSPFSSTSGNVEKWRGSVENRTGCLLLMENLGTRFNVENTKELFRKGKYMSRTIVNDSSSVFFINSKDRFEDDIYTFDLQLESKGRVDIDNLVIDTITADKNIKFINWDITGNYQIADGITYGEVINPIMTSGGLIKFAPNNAVISEYTREEMKAIRNTNLISVNFNNDRFQNELSNAIQKEDGITLDQEEIERTIETVLVQRKEVKDFYDNIRNLDKARVLFYFSADNCDLRTGISAPEIIYKDVDSLPSIIRPIIITDELVESILANVEVIKYLGVKDTSIYDRSTLNDLVYGMISLRMNPYDKRPGTLKVDICNQVLEEMNCPYRLEEDLSSAGDLNGSNVSSASYYLSIAIDTGYVKVPVKLLEYLSSEDKINTFFKMLEIKDLKEHGISHIVNSIENPYSILGKILKTLNNKVIVMDFLRINSDSSYNVTSPVKSKKILENYYKEDNEIYNKILEGFKFLDNERVISLDKGSTLDPLGGNIGSYFRNKYNDNVLVDGFYSNVDGVVTINKSACLFRTIYIDIKESGLDSNSIGYEPISKLLLALRTNDKTVSKFLVVKHPLDKEVNETGFTGKTFVNYSSDLAIDNKKYYLATFTGVVELEPKYDRERTGIYLEEYKDGKLLYSGFIEKTLYSKYNIYNNENNAKERVKFLISVNEYDQSTLEEKLTSDKLYMNYLHKKLELDRYTMELRTMERKEALQAKTVADELSLIDAKRSYLLFSLAMKELEKKLDLDYKERKYDKDLENDSYLHRRSMEIMEMKLEMIKEEQHGRTLKNALDIGKLLLEAKKLVSPEKY